MVNCLYENSSFLPIVCGIAYKSKSFVRKNDANAAFIMAALAKRCRYCFLTMGDCFLSTGTTMTTFSPGALCCRYFPPLVSTVGTMGNRPLHGFYPCKGTSHCSHYKTFCKEILQSHSISLPLPRVGNRRTVCRRPLSMVKPPPRTCRNVCYMSKHSQCVCKSSLSGDKHALHMCKHFLSPRQTFLSRV